MPVGLQLSKCHIVGIHMSGLKYKTVIYSVPLRCGT